MQHVKCVLCGSAKFTPLFQSKDNRLHTSENIFNLVRCARCGTVYLNPRPEGVDLAAFYPEKFYAGSNVLSKLVSDFLNDTKFKGVNVFKKCGRILDVGCGDGGLLYVFKAHGWETYGVDISDNACQLARKKLGSHVYNNSLKLCSFPDSFFDVVFLNHVIEHMPCPYEELSEINRILKENGFVFVYTPNVNSFQFTVSGNNWLHLDSPRHLVLYSESSIRFLLEKIGFRVVKVNFPKFDFPFDLYVSLKTKFSSKNSWVVALVSPLLRLISITVKVLPSWRGSVEVVGVKKSLIHTLEGARCS